MVSVLHTARTLASFVKLSHTVFALPFAVAAFFAALAAPLQLTVVREHGEEPFLWAEQVIERASPSWIVACLCLVCMVGARSFAMAINRIADRKFDSLNPRTLSREIPAGKLTLRKARAFAATMAGLYFAACALLGPVVLALSIVPPALMVLYSYTKRFTWLCHFVLGASLGLAPVGAWVAVRAGGWSEWSASTVSTTVDRWLESPFLKVISPETAGTQEAFLGWMALGNWLPWLLGLSVMLWVAGFDIIYALQDDEFDRQNGLKSIPARFGRKTALRISKWVHFGSLLCLSNAARLFGDHCAELHMQIAQASGRMPYVGALFVGIVNVGTIAFTVGLIRQHAIVKPNDLTRVNAAFFTVNGVISIIVGAAFVAAYLAAIWL